MNEREWQEQVIELAQLNGWAHLHVRKSIGRRGGKAGWQTTTNLKGWPDLFLWHERDQRTLAIELKVRPNTATSDQLAVLASLRAAGIESYVMFPEQLDELAAVLARRRIAR